MKTQKTIVLSSYEYFIKNGVVFYFGHDAPIESPYKIGATCLLISKTDVSPNAILRGDNIEKFYLRFDWPSGVHVNVNADCIRTSFTGWYRTADNMHIEVYGKRKIIRIYERKNSDISITVGPEIVVDP